MKSIEKHEAELNSYATKLISEIDGISILGPSADKRGGILSFNIEKMDFHQIAIMLSEFNIMVRSGQHCVHSWFDASGIKGSVRASFYLYNTKEEIDKFIEAMKNITKMR